MNRQVLGKRARSGDEPVQDQISDDRRRVREKLAKVKNSHEGQNAAGVARGEVSKYEPTDEGYATNSKLRFETESREEHKRNVSTAIDEAVAEKGLSLGIDVQPNAVSPGDTKIYDHDDAVSTAPVADAYKASPQLSVAINQDAEGGAELTSQGSATVDTSHLDHQASQEKVNTMQQRIAQLEDEAKQTRGEMDQIRQEYNELRHQLDSIQGDKNVAESTVSAQASTIGVLQATNDSQQRELLDTQQDLRAAELALDVWDEDLQESEHSNTQLRSHVADLEGRVADLRRDNAALEDQIAALKDENFYL